MFDRLQKKWKVSGLQLLLILCTFAIGGSLTGYSGRKLMGLLPISQSWLWILVYILLITLIWPLAVLIVSIPFGQFRFFTGYLKKLGRRIGIGPNELVTEGYNSTTISDSGANKMRSATRSGSNPPINIAIFASGAGSNAQQLIHYFRYSKKVKISLVVCNKPGAGVLQIAEREHIPTILLDKETFFRGNAYVDELLERNIGLIVLAGFLWKIPATLIRAFPGRIINIHPALLPKYGGKGMYGQFVHASVLANGEKESGISIHYVDELYDHGQLVYQVNCPVLESDTPESLAQRIHKLEHEHYPRIVESIVDKIR